MNAYKWIKTKYMYIYEIPNQRRIEHCSIVLSDNFLIAKYWFEDCQFSPDAKIYIYKNQKIDAVLRKAKKWCENKIKRGKK